MQQRMKEFTMEEGAIKALLKRAQYGHISTIGSDGYPYAVAVHFVYYNEKIFFHGLPKGEKLDNISKCSKVCFSVDEMKGLMVDGLESPCKAYTEYESVVIRGDARVVEDIVLKQIVLREIIRKYMPLDPEMPVPEKMEGATAVIEVSIGRITGKYHR